MKYGIILETLHLVLQTPAPTHMQLRVHCLYVVYDTNTSPVKLYIYASSDYMRQLRYLTVPGACAANTVNRLEHFLTFGT